MYYIILGILMILVNGFDMWFNVFFVPLMWDRKEKKDKILKIVCWVLAVVAAISLFAKGGAEQKNKSIEEPAIVEVAE